MAAFTLYGAFLSSPTYKVGLMLALCGQPFAYRHVDLAKGQHKSPEYRAINRYGQVPALVHEGVNLCQSNAILTYLADRLGRFGGRDAAERQRVQEWLFWDFDRFAATVGRIRFFTRFLKPEPAVFDFFRSAADAGLRVLEDQLAQTPFVAGDQPTIADIACYGNVAHLAEGNIDLAAWPNIQAWAGRIQALPGYQAPYDLLPKQDREAA